MYEQIVIVTFVVGLQLTLSWRYHTIYMKLHREFKKAVDSIVGERKNLFRTELQSLAKELADAEKNRENGSKSRAKDVEYDKKEEMLFNLVANINEPMNVYLKTRNAVRRLSEYLLFSAILALSGLLPAALNMVELVFFYFLFLLPLSVAVLAWLDFNALEEKLVSIRDQER